MNYQEIDKNEVPEDIRFNIPGRNQGQIIEVAYGGNDDSSGQYDIGDPYMRVVDSSEKGWPITFYQLEVK